ERGRPGHGHPRAAETRSSGAAHGGPATSKSGRTARRRWRLAGAGAEHAARHLVHMPRRAAVPDDERRRQDPGGRLFLLAGVLGAGLRPRGVHAGGLPAAARARAPADAAAGPAARALGDAVLLQPLLLPRHHLHPDRQGRRHQHDRAADRGHPRLADAGRAHHRLARGRARNRLRGRADGDPARHRGVPLGVAVRAGQRRVLRALPDPHPPHRRRRPAGNLHGLQLGGGRLRHPAGAALRVGNAAEPVRRGAVLLPGGAGRARPLLRGAGAGLRARERRVAVPVLPAPRLGGRGMARLQRPAGRAHLGWGRRDRAVGPVHRLDANTTGQPLGL
ncbi:MAG: Permease of the drug/metabolite transporter (DMT) superfamily, partial [uncultured Acetobacteraceae bacterium]